MSPLSTFLNGQPYTRLRGAAFLMLSESGHIVSGTITDDTGGGGTSVWSAGTAAIPCRVDPLTGGEAVMAGRISDRSTHLITVPPGLGLTVRNRFAVNNRGTFEVTAVQERTASPLDFVEVVGLA